MAVNTYRIRNIIQTFPPQRYNRVMKTLSNSLHFEKSDPARFRLQVLNHGKRYGWRSACDAYKISKSSYFRWRGKLNKNQGKLCCLIPQKTNPKRTRRPQTSSFILSQIKTLRTEHGNLGKDKIKALIDEYTQGIGIKPVSASTIGRIINRYQLFTKPLRQVKAKSKYARDRIKKAPKVNSPGYIEVDCATMMILGKRYYFVCLIDIYTKISSVVILLSPPTSLSTKKALIAFTSKLPFPIHSVQTDNGSEFLGAFHQYLQEINIKHIFTYPSSPRINGVIERFNRTLKDEFLKVSKAIRGDILLLDKHLEKWLNWYNQKRPHYSLGYQSPMSFFNNYHSQK